MEKGQTKGRPKPRQADQTLQLCSCCLGLGIEPFGLQQLWAAHPSSSAANSSMCSLCLEPVPLHACGFPQQESHSPGLSHILGLLCVHNTWLLCFLEP